MTAGSRTPIWQSIHQTLADEIARGHYRPGDKLPTEAELSRRFGVNRHTVRRALAALTEAGVVHARRGSGVFVTARPTEYPIGGRVRFHQNILAAGRTPEKRVLRVETRPADTLEADALKIATGDTVHVYEGLSLADGVPIAHFTSVFPASRCPGIDRALAQQSSVTAALKVVGITDYTRAHTRLTAERATATQALHLNISEGAPVLRAVGVNIDPDGQPVEYGRTWFCGDRVTLTVGEA